MYVLTYTNIFFSLFKLLSLLLFSFAILSVFHGFVGFGEKQGSYFFWPQDPATMKVSKLAKAYQYNNMCDELMILPCLILGTNVYCMYTQTTWWMSIIFVKVDLLLGSILLGSYLPPYYELFLQIDIDNLGREP